MNESFGRWLKEKIQQSGKTQVQVASEVGISPGHLCLMLGNKRGRKKISPGTLVLLAIAVSATWNEVFTEAGIDMPLCLKINSMTYGDGLEMGKLSDAERVLYSSLGIKESTPDFSEIINNRIVQPARRSGLPDSKIIGPISKILAEWLRQEFFEKKG